MIVYGGEALWSPFDILALWGNRTAVWFCAFGWIVVSLSRLEGRRSSTSDIFMKIQGSIGSNITFVRKHFAANEGLRR